MDSALPDAGCVTLARYGDVAAVARAFGGDPERGRRLSLAAAADLSPGSPEDAWVALRSAGTWVLAVEVNGWQGSRPEVLERVSAGTLAVSSYWNVNGTTRFCYAAGGRQLVEFDALFPDRRYGDDPDCLEELRAGLPWDQPELPPVMLALAARVTGLALGPELFDGDFDVVPVEPLLEAIRSELDPGHAALTYDDPPVAWALRHGRAQIQRDVALTAARYAAQVTGLADEPAVTLALRGEGGAAMQGLDKLLARFTRAARDGGGDPRPGGRWSAVTALRETTNTAPLTASLNAVNAASWAVRAFGLDDDGLRVEVLAVLGNPRPPSGSMGLTSAPGPRPVDRYMWTAAHWLATVGTISYVQAPAADVVRILGADPHGAETGTPRLSPDPVAAVRAENDWSVVVDHHDWPGRFVSFTDLPGPAVTISWSGNGRALLNYSADGRLLIHYFDPQRPEQATDDDLAVLRDHLGGLRLGYPTSSAAVYLPVLLVLAERLTGVAFDPAGLDAPHILVPGPLRNGRSVRRREN